MFGALLGAGLDALSSAFNASQQYKNQKKLMEQQHQYNLETMAKQQEYAVQNWQMNNEYNDPSAVVDRYKNAGIDANAAFGGSGHYTPSQQAANPAAVGTGAPTAPLAKYLDPGSMLDRMLQMAQIEKVKAETGQIEGNTKDPNVTRDQQRADLQATEIANSLGLSKQKSVDLQNSFQESLNRVQNATEGMQIEAAKVSLQQNYAELDNLIKQGKLTDANIDETLARIQLVNEQVISETVKRQLMSAQIGLTNAQASETYAKIQEIQHKLPLLDQQARNEYLKGIGIQNQNDREYLIREAMKLQNEEHAIRNKNLPKDLKAQRFKSYSSGVLDYATTAAKVVATATGAAALAGYSPGNNGQYVETQREFYDSGGTHVGSTYTRQSSRRY